MSRDRQSNSELEKRVPYKRELSCTYALGRYPSYRALELAPDRCLEVLVESENLPDTLDVLCKTYQIPVTVAPRVLERLSRKTYAPMAVVVNKEPPPAQDRPQVLLESVDDMGNLGTIMRTMVAFNVLDLILVGACCDCYDPRVIRASMGACFSLSISSFESILDWKQRFPDRQLACLQLTEDTKPLRLGMEEMSLQQRERLTLAFGNEGAGLSLQVSEQTSRHWMIPQSPLVDSLNLAQAVGISLYEWQQPLLVPSGD